MIVGKFGSIVILTVQATCARASFDLLLLPGADGRVYRHDPVNNVALGSYAAGVDNLVSHDALGRSYAGSSGSPTFVTNNFNTGEVVGGLGASSFRSTEVNGSFLFGNSLSLIRQIDLNTGLQTASSALSTAATWHSMSTFGSVVQIFGVHATTGNMALTSASVPSATPGAFFTTTVALLGGSTLGKAAVGFNPTYGTQQAALAYIDTGGSLIFGRFSLNSSGGYSSTTPLTVALTGFNSAAFMPATLTSHSGWFVVGQDSASASLMRIQQFVLVGSNIVRTQNYTITAPGGGFGTHPSGVYQPSNVVAPEPGTMVVLGLGVVALLRRRKNCR